MARAQRERERRGSQEGWIADDNIQRQAQGYVVPDSFTHGTSEQRVRWFRKGLETGDVTQGDTFGASEGQL
jgi:uncharacterized protein